jgi:hypothetical protein
MGAKLLADMVASQIDEIVHEKVRDMEDIMYALNGTEEKYNDGPGMGEIFLLSTKVALSQPEDDR